MFWLGRGFSDLGLNLWFLAAAWLTLELTDSQAWVGLVGGVTAIPEIAVSLYGGVLSDRSERWRIIARTQLSLVAIVGVIALLVVTHQIEPWHFLIGAVAIGATDGFGSPTYGAFVVNLVGRERIFAANSMAQFANFTGELIGPLAAGLLIATAGIESVFVLALGASGISLVAISQISARTRGTMSARGGDFLSDMRSGLRFTRRTAGLPPLLAVTASALFSAAIFPLIPVYARSVLDVGGAGFGILMTSIGAGFIAGSALGVVFGNLPRKGRTLLFLAFVWNVGMIGFAFSDNYLLSIGILFVMGTAGALTENIVMTSVQRLAPDDTRGRVMSIWRVADSFNPLGMILGGVLAATFTNEIALVVTATLGLSVVVLAIGLSPSVRRL